MDKAPLVAPIWHASPIVQVIVLGHESSEYISWLQAMHGEEVDVVQNPRAAKYFGVSVNVLADWIARGWDNQVVYLTCQMLAPMFVRLGQASVTGRSGRRVRFGIIVQSHDLGPDYIASMGTSGLYHVADGKIVQVWQGEGPNRSGKPVDPPLF